MIYQKPTNPNQYNYRSKISYIIYIILLFLFLTSDAFAIKNYIRKCSPEGNPMGNAEATVTVGKFGGVFSKEIEVELSNKYCMTTIMVNYAVMKGLILAMNIACDSGSKIPNPLPTPFEDSLAIAKAHIKMITTTNHKCTAATLSVDAGWAAIVLQLTALHEAAEAVYKNSRICGSNWHKYNSTTMLKDLFGDYKTSLKAWNTDIRNAKDTNITNMKYREWYYDGVEREDKECKDVTMAKVNGQYPGQKYYYRGSEPATFNCDKYNIKKGSFDDPLTINNKAISPARAIEYQEAYDCCVKKSQGSVCIEYNPKAAGSSVLSKITGDTLSNKLVGNTSDGWQYKICGANTKCTIDKIEFETKSLYNNTMICVDSYSLCPYNFSIGGGTAECDAYGSETVTESDVKKGECGTKSDIRSSDCSLNSRAGKCKNYCQVLENCVIIDYNNFNYETSITSPFFSTACLDFVGDSKNNTGYDAGLITGSQKHFSAPIAQCIRETIENVFYNRAGHTKCKNSYEIPDKNGNCFSDNYIYKKGEPIYLDRDQKIEKMGFFPKLQQSLGYLVKLLLILSVMITGYKVMMGEHALLHHKEIIKYVVKIGIVTFFVVGTAWQTGFFNGIYKVSEVVSTIVFKVTVNNNENKRDGCQFGPMVDEKNTSIAAANTAYPEGKEYLAVWDSMDCKIARYLGLGMGANVPNIAKLILASFLTGTFGIWFAVFLSIFGVMLVIATINMLHIFLASAMSIIIMVYISIITIPLSLFKKTEGIFNKWLTNLMSLAFQPVILFAYIGIFIAIFDNIMIGSATFTGTPPERSIVCEDACFDISGVKKAVPSGKTAVDVCDASIGDKLVSPRTDSIACMIDSKNSSAIGKWPGLELIGIGIPILQDVFTNEGRKRIEKQILTLLKAALLMYILSSFVSQVPEIATALLGGTALKGSDISLKNVMSKLQGAVGGAVLRANRGIRKATKKPAKRAATAASAMANRAMAALFDGSGSSKNKKDSNDSTKSE